MRVQSTGVDAALTVPAEEVARVVRRSAGASSSAAGGLQRLRRLRRQARRRDRSDVDSEGLRIARIA